MPKILGWFDDTESLLSLVNALKSTEADVSVLAPTTNPAEFVVKGSLSRDLNCYPFLDLPRHMQRLGMDSTTAERYAQALEHGASIVCIQGGPSLDTFDQQYHAHDASLIP